MNYKKKNTSFTLIELLVVIVIIGVLAGVIIVTTSSSISNANLAKAKAFSSNMQSGMFLSLISEWTFDEPEEGGKTKDSWGGNDGTINGATRELNTSGECISGGCYSFDGDDYITFDKVVYLTYNNFTIGWWMKRTESDYECIFSRSIGDSNGQIEVDATANAIRFESNTNNIFQNSAMATNLNLSDGGWHHFVISSSPTEFSLYSDGVRTYSMGANTDAVDQAFRYIGAQQLQGTYVYGDYFEGYIDDVGIYKKAMSSAQIKQNYIAGLNSMLANGSISNKDYNERINELAYEE